MKRLLCVLVVSGVVAAGALLQHPTTVQAGDACGEKGQPDCPLQGWMEKNVQKPLDDGDLKAVAVGLQKSIALVPDPKWNDGDNGWAKLAQEGVDAAKSGDLAATKKNCKSCHKAWRDKYKKEFRTKPVKG